jgi:tetratricopeptide (TPR) repeat protein
MNKQDMLRQSKKNQILDCPSCEQPITSDQEVCPHCHNDFQIGLELTAEEFSGAVKDLRNKLNTNDDEDARKELVKLLYCQAMKLRYINAAESLVLFEDVVELDSKHWEARLKVSWLSIRFTKNERAIDVLLPVVASTETTLLQKQRAYTNLSCAENWKDKDLANYEEAEKWARTGIDLDGEGTAKLWENLATALKHQSRLEEARIAFKQALKLNPKSINAIERQASIEKHLKIQKKRDGKHKKFHLKSPREFISGNKRKSGGTFVKI